MTTRGLLTRIRRVEKSLEARPSDGFPPLPRDLDGALAEIASIRTILSQLSVIDRKRWYCPYDPRSVMASGEVEQEAKLRLDVLEKMKTIGFPNGYRQEEYAADMALICNLKDKPLHSFGSSEQALNSFLTARTEGLYEAGPRYRAHQRIEEIDGCFDPFAYLNRTVVEWHEIDHLEDLHPRTNDDDARYSNPLNGKTLAQSRRDRLHEWHSRRGTDPRRFQTFYGWMLFPSNPKTFDRQNQQLIALGFEASKPHPRGMTKAGYDATFSDSVEHQKRHFPEVNVCR